MAAGKAGRERGDNVIDVEHDKNQIMNAIKLLARIMKGHRQSFVYGNGDAGKKMADVLAKVTLRYSKILQFQDEKPMFNPSPVRVKRSTRQKHKAA